MKEVIKKLEQAILNPNFQEDGDFTEIYAIMEEIEKQENAVEYIKPILKLMRDNPDAYYGTPGPVVNFLENYINEDLDNLLVKSLNISVTDVTLDLFLTVIAQTDEDDKRYKSYVKKLKKLYDESDLTDEQIEVIEDFIECELDEDDDE